MLTADSWLLPLGRTQTDPSPSREGAPAPLGEGDGNKSGGVNPPLRFDGEIRSLQVPGATPSPAATGNVSEKLGSEMCKKRVILGGYLAK